MQLSAVITWSVLADITWMITETEAEYQLEQLEHLRSEDTPRRLMITHTIESYWIPSQKRQSQSYKFKEFVKI